MINGISSVSLRLLKRFDRSAISTLLLLAALVSVVNFDLNLTDSEYVYVLFG